MTEHLDRDRIIEEARRQLARHGFKRASLAAIVARLGVTKSALYHHFPGGKGEIIDACLRRGEGEIFAAMRSAVDAQRDPREQLRAMVLAKMEWLDKLRGELAISDDVGRELINLYQQQRRRFNDFEESLLTSILIRGQEQGLFRRTDARQLARALRVNLQHLEVPLVFEMEPEALPKHVDTLLDLVFHGIVRPEQRAPRSRRHAEAHTAPA